VGTDDLFDTQFRQAFAERFASLVRYLDRLSGDPALAADIAQEAFVKLYHRGTMPEDTRAWLVSVANNLFRDERRRVSRRLRLLARRSPDATLGDPAPAPDAHLFSDAERNAVRAALQSMPERDRQLLLLREAGLSYRELAIALSLVESSVGTLLMRARLSFQLAVASLT
jgi:RNA polymerase sigma factor (sigma-70 family)